MKCPICYNVSDRVFEKYGYWILECNECHHRFCELQPSLEHVNTIYSDQYFTGGEAGYSNYLAEQKSLIEHGEQYGDFVNKFTSPGKMLDVGSAAGFILKGFENKGWVGRGIEPNPTMTAFAKNELGLSVETGTLENAQINEQFKLITMIQVIGHFYDLRSAFQIAADLTEPGGYLLIESWDKDSRTARLFGKNWHEYSPPSVLQWFSTRTLKLLVGQYGFTEVSRYRPPKWLNGDHAKSLLQYKLQDLPLKRITTGITGLIPEGIKIPYPLDDFIAVLFKKA